MTLDEQQKDANTGTDLRLFTAIPIPPETKERIAELLSRLRKGATFTGAHPAWVAPENIHITLVFLGSQPADRLGALQEAIDLAAGAASGPFELKLGGLHLFPNPKEPRVVSLGISGKVEQLESIRETLARELRQRGFEVEARPFRPHVTIARIKSMRGLPGLRNLITTHQRIEPGRFEIDRITLYKSTLHSTGAQYKVLHESFLPEQQV